ncbi:hypothetical protein K32_44390 [Kaistia sp. 32K]|nr:hypothetical protein K32_44390 [Kaistia sp. 32K]
MHATASYIRDLSKQLSNMAKKHRMLPLAQTLKEASKEAAKIADTPNEAGMPSNNSGGNFANASSGQKKRPLRDGKSAPKRPRRGAKAPIEGQQALVGGD